MLMLLHLYLQVKLAGVPHHPRVRLLSLQVWVCDWDCPASFESNLFTQALQVTDTLTFCGSISMERSKGIFLQDVRCGIINSSHVEL